MTIQTLKQSLDIIQIAQKLGIAINKSGKACCPFHNDKTPSLQFSKEKQIATCFSSNCDAGTMDVINLTEKKLNLSTHEALVWLKEQVGIYEAPPQTEPTTTIMKANYNQDFEQMQSSFIASSTARAYAKKRGLDKEKLPLGYNAFKSSKFSYLRGCITFALRDKQNKIASLYGRSVRNNDKSKHYYTPNRTGLYPNYPGQNTKRIILTESIIDAATLLCIEKITKEYQILSLYGTNGLTTEHVNAIQQLENLEEIVLFFDGDKAGKQANQKHAEYLQKLLESVKISIVQTPDDEDINSLFTEYDADCLLSLLNERAFFITTLTIPSTPSFQEKNVASIEKKK